MEKVELQNAKKKNQLKAKNIGRVIKDKNEEKKVEEEKNNSNEN